MTSTEWDQSYMNVPAFMDRLFALRVVRHELRANPRMEIANFRINVGAKSSQPIPVVRDYRLPPYICVLVDLSSGARQVLVFAPDRPPPVAD